MQTQSLPFKDCYIVEELKGGSHRKFYRVNCKGKYRILMEGSRENVEKYASIAKMLHKEGLHVPEIYELDGRHVLMEDLGDMSLYRYVKTYGPCVDMYKKVLDELVKLQSKKIPDLLRFDDEKLLLEYEHFKRFYVPYAGVNIRGWEEKVRGIVKKCVASPLVPMHRDFQSTNIYIKEGKICFVDFQDMHLGPMYFDLAALLFDPYVMLQNSTIWELVEYYKESHPEFDKDSFLACGILRIMQALGAFVRLSSEGKDFFKGFIRKGKCRLKGILRDAGLNEMADSL